RQWFFGKRSQRVRDGTDETTVDVDRASAHTGNDTGICQRTAFEPGQNQVAVGANNVFQYPQDVGPELLDPRARDHRAPDGDHATANLLDTHWTGWCRLWRGNERGTHSQWQQECGCKPANIHGDKFHYSGEVLGGQGEMAISN